MLHIYFVRHGQTDWNQLRRFQGQQDVPLNELGRRQAEAIAGRLKGARFDALYASDLSRAGQTAEIVNEHHGLPMARDVQLRERSFGCFEGHTIEESRQKYPELRAAYERDSLNFRIPGGESRLEFIRRVGAFFEGLREKHADQTVAIVAHGGVLGALFSHIISHKLGFSSPQFVPLFSVENCSLSQLQHDERWLVISLNETEHLRELVSQGRVVGEYA